MHIKTSQKAILMSTQNSKPLHVLSQQSTFQTRWRRAKVKSCEVWLEFSQAVYEEMVDRLSNTHTWTMEKGYHKSSIRHNVSGCPFDLTMWIMCHQYNVLECSWIRALWAVLWKHHLSHDMRFPTMWYVRPAKPQISLRIRAAWSEPLLVAWIFYEC